jgi:hypothetical protein
MDEREVGLQLLDDSVTGCTLVFVPADPFSSIHEPMSALAVLAGLHGRRFTGVCECYIRPDVYKGEYLMGIALGFPCEPAADDWWGAFVSNIQDACADDKDIRLERDACEFTTVSELRATMLHAGTAGFEDGAAVWVSDPAGPDPDSPFTALCRRAR